MYYFHLYKLRPLVGFSITENKIIKEITTVICFCYGTYLMNYNELFQLL